MNTPQKTRQERALWAALWLPGLLVALGAGVATAHGLYEVAVAAGVPPVIAALYPLITDGLALVAYGATTRLHDGGQRYAWAVVVLAAGLSGLAQASYLGGGVAATAPPLRFGVGAWPAVAAAIVAHLLFLLSAHGRSTQTSTLASPPVADRSVGAGSASTPSTGITAPERPALPPTVQDPAASTVHRADRPAVHRTGVQPSAESARPASNHPASRRASEQRPAPSNPRPEQAVPSGPTSPASDRARAAARRHAAHHGELPTVSQLMSLADVSRGTAGTALKDLREHPAQLQVVSDAPKTRTQP